jgi:Mg-chelatase subunit ChlD
VNQKFGFVGNGFPALLLLLILATFPIALGVGCDDDDAESSSDLSADVTGVVLDPSGAPLADVRVTYAGQQADALTNSKGQWKIGEVLVAPKDTLPVTASLPGFSSYSRSLAEFKQWHTIPIELDPLQSRPGSSYIHVIDPLEDENLLLPTPCADAQIEIVGYLGDEMDILFVVDASASVENEIPGMPGVRVVDRMKELVLDMTNSIDLTRHQAGLLRFFGTTQTLSGLTQDAPALSSAIESFEANPQGTTNIESAIYSAIDVLSQSGRANAQKRIVLLSDGIPTAHGHPALVGYQDLINQDPEDIEGALDAAAYAAGLGIEIFTIAVGDEAVLSNLTTLPAIADLTQGKYYLLPDSNALSSILSTIALAGSRELEVWDHFNDFVYVVGEVELEGTFRATVPVKNGANWIELIVFVGEGANRIEFATRDWKFMALTSQGRENVVICN